MDGSPLSVYTKGDSLRVKVIGIHDSKTHSYLAISHRQSKSVSMSHQCLLKPVIVMELCHCVLLPLFFTPTVTLESIRDGYWLTLLVCANTSVTYLLSLTACAELNVNVLQPPVVCADLV